MTPEYRPLHYQDDNVWKGVEIEMISSLGAFLGVKTEIKTMEIKDLEKALKAGNIDIILGGYSRSIDRAKEIWFSDPYLEITPAVLVDRRVIPQRSFGEDFEEKQLQTLWDLHEIPPIVLAVKQKSVYQRLIAENFPGYQLHLVANNQEGLDALSEGKAQGLVHDSLYLTDLLRRNGALKSRYLLLKGGGFKELICAGLPFGDTTLKVQIDTWIAELQRQGKIDQWLKDYMPE